MMRPLLVMTAGAVLAFASVLSVGAARAHERCVCSSADIVTPLPSVAPLPPLPPVAPMPPEAGRRHARVQREIIVIGPSDVRRVRHLRRVVRIREETDGNRRVVRVHEEDDGDRKMTRDEFIKRAERAFDAHDRNHDGVLDEDERDEMTDPSEAPEALEAPEPPEPPEPGEAPEPPRAPHAPHG